MSVLDRVTRHQKTVSDGSGQTSQESFGTTISVSDPPVVRRVRIVISQLIDYAESNATSRYARFAWVARGMADEMMEELVDVHAPNLEQWFTDFGRVIEWCGTGDPSTLPESVRDFIRTRFPSELPAIEAGVG